MAYNKTQSSDKVNYKNNNTKKFYSNKDRDNIYEPKKYPKKTKSHNVLFDIPMFEYEIDKERQRQKREMDRKKPKNKKYRHYDDYE